MIPIVSGHDAYDLVMPGGMQSLQIAVLACGIIGYGTMASHGVGVPTSQEELQYLVEMNENKYTNAQTNAFCPITNGMWNHRERDEFWQDPWTSNVGRVTIPVWVWGGWNDIFRLAIPRLYSALGSKDKMLTMGLDSHSSPGGPDGFDKIKESLRWFDYWLKGKDTGIRKELDTNRFHYYVNQRFGWKSAKTWPIPGTRYTPWYFGGSSDAVGATAALSPSVPATAGADNYVYDPSSGRANSFTYDFAAPLSAGNAGNDQPQGYGVDSPEDQRLELGAGAVAYVSPPLSKDMEATGPVTAKLFATTTAGDTDFVVKLVDVFPDTPGASGPGRPGYWNLVTDGNIKGTFRSYATQYRRQTPIPAGKAVQFGVRLDPTSYEFKKGHRIAVIISSADVPRLMPNPNPAAVTILHSAKYPSQIVLPLTAT
jgi:putative CocE/NonD family hydrolase